MKGSTLFGGTVLTCEDSSVIENGAVVNADIFVGSLIIGGTVRGNIQASESVEMLSTGKVYGNIKTAKLKIADGVVFDGNCEMIKKDEEIDIFSARVEPVSYTHLTLPTSDLV